MSILVISALIAVIIIVVVYLSANNTGGNNATTKKIPPQTALSKDLANAQNSAKALYDALQAAYTQLHRDVAQDSNFMSFMGVYDGIIPSASFTFSDRASAAVTVISNININIALVGCDPRSSSQCGYYTMLMALSENALPANASSAYSIASGSKDLPAYFTPLKSLIIDCNRVYNDVLTAVSNTSPTSFPQNYITNYSPSYFSSVTYLATNFDTLVNNATQTGQILARMLP